LGITLKKYLLPILSFTLLVLTDAEAINVSASGVWADLRIDESNLIGGPGTNLTSSYESDPAATLITVSDTKNKNDSWKIGVSMNGSSWPAALSLYVKRTSGGNGRGQVTGGLSYQKVTAIETDFFTGEGDRDDIAIQYKLTGMSITIDPGNYSTTVTFTIIDIK
jgi:hypothetical protein